MSNNAHKRWWEWRLWVWGLDGVTILTSITVRGVKGRERNRKKSHLLLLDPNPIDITPFLFKQKGRGRERGEKGEVEGKGE